MCLFIIFLTYFFTKLFGDVCFAYATGGAITKVYSWMSFSLNAMMAFVLLIYMNYIIIKKVRSSGNLFRDNESQGHQNGQGQSNAVSSRGNKP